MTLARAHRRRRAAGARQPRVLLARDPQAALAGECGSGAEAIAAIRQQRPDLLFLDVQMPESTASTCSAARRRRAAGDLFVTAPTSTRCAPSMRTRSTTWSSPSRTPASPLALARAKEQAPQAGTPALAQRIVVKSGRQLHVVPLADIDWIESADYCVDLHVGARTYSLRRSMAAVEAELEPAGFCRDPPHGHRQPGARALAGRRGGRRARGRCCWTARGCR